jgi:hypothetical protein
MSDKEKIKLQQWWMEQLRDLTRKVMKEEEKRLENAKKKCFSLLGEYSSIDDINEAYGVGNITEKQRDRLVDLWERANDGGDPLYEAKITLLQEAYEEAQRIMQELGQEV